MLKALSATGQKYLFDEFGATNFLALMEGVTHFGPGGMQGHRNVINLVGTSSGIQEPGMTGVPLTPNFYATDPNFRWTS